jgi:acetoin utilization deacetylase AcuC-like enzyme
MILHDPHYSMRFEDYGILIPVRDSRANRVIQHLATQPRLSDSSWLTNRITTRIDRADLERVHDATYVATLFGDAPYSGGRGGLETELLKTYELIDQHGRPQRYAPQRAIKPLGELFSTILGQVAGTYQASAMALDSGFCFFLGGGMHHARRDGGAGFCLINDIMIAVEKLRSERNIRLAWIIDVDAHKGDGTAELITALRAARTSAAQTSAAQTTAARTSAARTSAARTSAAQTSAYQTQPGTTQTRSGTTPPVPPTLALSAHMASGWPLNPETLAAARMAGRGPNQAPFVSSDVDIAIASGAENSYLPLLAEGLERLETLSQGVTPDIVIVVDGADACELDELPSTAELALSPAACLERDLLILDFLDRRGIPSAWLMAGGYGDRAWEPPANFLAACLGKRR